jgi:glycosyltransferase involved in cell wall biosynthesis
MIKISIVIPVFNAEQYLKPCIDSLINQSLKEIEFIFVNDGSIDSSQKIIESYGAKDARIKLINQENKGVSAARNAGIAIAKGSYLAFVDGDDFIKPDFLEQLYSTAIQYGAQIITSNFNTQLDGKIICSKPIFETNKVFSAAEIKQQIVPFFVEQDLMNTACNKLYNKELIQSNNIVFPVGVTNGEDGLFNIQAFYKCDTAYFLDYNGYFYREVSGSATRNFKKNDYFKMALEKFELDYSQFGIEFKAQNIRLLKSKRLINNLVSLIHIGLDSNNEMSFKDKKKSITNMISNATVQQVITEFWQDLKSNKSKYHQFILHCIKNKSVFGLILAVKYSNFRNRK